MHKLKKKNNFSDIYAEYILFKETNIKQQTFSSLKHDFQKRILPFFKDYYIEDITRKTILDWKNYTIANMLNQYFQNKVYLYNSFSYLYCLSVVCFYFF